MKKPLEVWAYLWPASIRQYGLKSTMYLGQYKKNKYYWDSAYADTFGTYSYSPVIIPNIIGVSPGEAYTMMPVSKRIWAKICIIRLQGEAKSL